MLSIRGTNFIAHWAYAERISSHAEHTRNRFHRMLSMRGNVKKSNISANSNKIFKNLVVQALGTIWFRFLQKKYLKKFHACVPLSSSSAYTAETIESLLYSINMKHEARKRLICENSPRPSVFVLSERIIVYSEACSIRPRHFRAFRFYLTYFSRNVISLCFCSADQYLCYAYAQLTQSSLCWELVKKCQAFCVKLKVCSAYIY